MLEHIDLLYLYKMEFICNCILLIIYIQHQLYELFKKKKKKSYGTYTMSIIW